MRLTHTVTIIGTVAGFLAIALTGSSPRVRADNDNTKATAKAKATSSSSFRSVFRSLRYLLTWPGKTRI